MAARKHRPLTRAEKLLASDGALCLNFVNAGRARRPALGSYGDLLAWAVGVGALTPAGSRRLATAAGNRPAQAGDMTRRAETLRARLERIFRAAVEGRSATARDLEILNADLRRVMAGRRLEGHGGGYRWGWGEIDGEHLDRVLQPVLLSAADLLVSPDLGRVRRCPGKSCGLFFLAASGGKPRKWCGAACRSRNSTRTFYAKTLKPRRDRRKRAAESARSIRLAGWD